VFRPIYATASSMFLNRIIVFALGRSGAAGAKKANYAENEQICRDSKDYQTNVNSLVRRADIGSQITVNSLRLASRAGL
jgi:hypothetical protein